MLTRQLKISKLAAWLYLCCIAFSCQKKQDKISLGYYNVDSLITSQIYVLPTRKASLVKLAGVDGKIDSTHTGVTDSTFWSHELDILRQLDFINKPANSHSFTIETLSDTKSNLTIRAIISHKKKPAEYFKIYYQGSLANLKKIEAFYHEENLLYKKSRKFSMDFEKIYNTITLVNYAIEGEQKMLLGDAVKFFLKGKVVSNQNLSYNKAN